MKTNRILFLFLILCNSLTAIADGYIGAPLYQSLSRIDYFTKVKILEKKIIENIDTCINGKIINNPPKYHYKCRLIDNVYGNVTDSILNLTYSDPQFHEYDDSCNITVSYWIITYCRGIEKELVTDDVVYVCFDQFHQIISAIKTLTEMDKFLINHLVELKKVDKFKLGIENSNAIGKTKSNEFCQLKLNYESSVENYIPSVKHLHNNVITKYICKPTKELGNIDSNTVWEFKITRKKIIIYCKQKKYSLYIYETV
jgi:hypothetical protein